MSRFLALSSLILLLGLSFSTPASAHFGRWLGNVLNGGGYGYYPQPYNYVAYEGQTCSNYPQGPRCAPGLVCTGGNWGFGVCQRVYQPGWNNGGGHCGGGYPNGHHNGGGHWHR